MMAKYVCEVVDSRNGEVMRDPAGWCPPGEGEPATLHIISLDSEGITVRSCTPKGAHPLHPEKTCAIDSKRIGWCGHEGDALMWCETAEGISSETIPIAVPEPDIWLGFAVALAVIFGLWLLGGYRRR